MGPLVSLVVSVSAFDDIATAPGRVAGPMTRNGLRDGSIDDDNEPILLL